MRKTLSTVTAGVILLCAAVAAVAGPENWRHEWPDTDFANHSVDLSEILSGGPSKDGIPAIDQPKFATVAESKEVDARDPVIGVELAGEARAYPLSILMWHEIVNDEIAGIPITVTYCPLCNSAVVFDRRVDGRVLDFGTTGKLRRSDLVMYDRQTESWWQQFLGEAIVGELTGTRLKTVPARLESFERFASRHPDGKVLVPANPGMRNYGYNPYAGYDSRDRPYDFFRGDLPEDIHPMARVVVFEAGGEPQAVALELLRETSTLEVADVVLTWSAGQASALDSPEITRGRDVGNIVVQRRSAGGLEDIVYDVTFAFVFHAFHPDLNIRQQRSPR